MRICSHGSKDALIQPMSDKRHNERSRLRDHRTIIDGAYCGYIEFPTRILRRAHSSDDRNWELYLCLDPLSSCKWHPPLLKWNELSDITDGTVWHMDSYSRDPRWEYRCDREYIAGNIYDHLSERCSTTTFSLDRMRSTS